LCVRESSFISSEKDPSGSIRSVNDAVTKREPKQAPRSGLVQQVIIWFRPIE
jgi:hypothetical protein